MRYADITTCDIENGDGVGVVLWCTGCSVGCVGCHNKCQQDPNSGDVFTDVERDRIIKELSRKEIHRLTISGGHPLEDYNIRECTDLCKHVRELFGDSISIWCYTGYLFEDVKDLEIMRYIDVLVDGRFEIDKRDISLPFRGSSNQRVIDVKKSMLSGDVVIFCE